MMFKVFGLAVLFVGLTACSSSETEDQGDPLERIDAALEALMPKLVGWHHNPSFLQQRLAGQLLAGRCSAAAESIAFVTDSITLQGYNRSDVASIEGRIFAALTNNRQNSQNGCFDEAVARLLSGIETAANSPLYEKRVYEWVIEQYVLSGNEPMANQIASNYRDHLIAAERHPGASQSALRDLQLKILKAYQQRGHQALAEVTLKSFWEGGLTDFPVDHDRDRSAVAKLAIEFGMMEFYFDLVSGYERHKWVANQAAAHYKAAMVEKPIQVGLRLLAYAPPDSVARTGLSNFFQFHAPRNPLPIREHAPNLFERISDDLARAKAQALFGAALGAHNDLDGSKWCERSREMAVHWWITGDQQKRRRVVDVIRSIGACVLATSGDDGLARLTGKFTNIRHKSAATAGAALHVMAAQDWGRFEQLIQATKNKDERYWVWLSLSNTVRNTPEYAVTEGVKNVLALHARGHRKQAEQRLMQQLLVELNAKAGQNDRDLPENFEDQPFTDRIALLLRTARAREMAGDRSGSRKLRKQLARMVLKTHSPEWISSAVFSFAAMGDWNLALDTVDKTPGLATRAFLLTGLYRVAEDSSVGYTMQLSSSRGVFGS